MPQINAPIRARDLRQNIKEMGFEQGVVHTLEAALEEFSVMRQNMRSLAEMMDMCVKQTETMIKIGTGLGDIVRDLQRAIKGEDEA